MNFKIIVCQFIRIKILRLKFSNIIIIKPKHLRLGEKLPDKLISILKIENMARPDKAD